MSQESIHIEELCPFLGRFTFFCGFTGQLIIWSSRAGMVSWFWMVTAVGNTCNLSFASTVME